MTGDLWLDGLLGGKGDQGQTPPHLAAVTCFLFWRGKRIWRGANRTGFPFPKVPFLQQALSPGL